jgi:pro-apoptotic serine protease NMA111
MKRKNVLFVFFLIAISSVYAGDWTEKMREEQKPKIVNIHAVPKIGLLTEVPYEWNGTGSIVDWNRGIILTNRHVSGISPMNRWEVSFSSGESVDAQLVYYHPWHDYAFLRFDPKNLQRTKPAEVEIGSHYKLKEGEEVLQIGNTASQPYSMAVLKVADLFGTDHTGQVGTRHTHMIHFSGQIAGGASGSPVFNKKGEIIALLNSGIATESFGLRIDYISDTLEQIRSPRKGDIHVRLRDVQEKDIHRYFQNTDEIRTRMNALRSRDPSIQNVAMVDRTQPGTPAFSVLRPGDIVLEIVDEAGKGITNLGQEIYLFDKIVDENVGKTVVLTVFRSGKIVRGLKLPVDDAENSKVLRFATFAGATFHPFTATAALYFGIPEKSAGVFLSEAKPGQSSFEDVGTVVKEGATNIHRFGKHRTLIQSLGKYPTPDLDAFIAAVGKLGNQSRVPVVFCDLWSDFVGPACAKVDIDLDFDPLRSFHWDSKAFSWVEDQSPAIGERN